MGLAAAGGGGEGGLHDRAGDGGAAALLPLMSPRRAEASSTTTATATAGKGASCALAQEMNQAYGVPALPTPCWAVPVLPPTVAPGIAALRPVPSSTTFTISSCSRSAVAGLMARPRPRRSPRRTCEPSAWVVRSTRYGDSTSPPLATAAATIAIWSGVAVVLNCPMAESASWSGLMSVSKFERDTQEGTYSPPSLKPNRRAASTIPRSPTRTPILAITVLQDHCTASAIEASAQPVLAFGSRVLVPGSGYGSGVSVGASTSVTTPESRAAAAVTILNVEPGGYVSRNARLSIGRAGSALSRAQAALTRAPVPESSDGS
ncbi:hypothetical protein GCM10020254_30930 [Streptomyces goshikiensis]